LRCWGRRRRFRHRLAPSALFRPRRPAGSLLPNGPPMAGAGPCLRGSLAHPCTHGARASANTSSNSASVGARGLHSLRIASWMCCGLVVRLKTCLTRSQDTVAAAWGGPEGLVVKRLTAGSPRRSTRPNMPTVLDPDQAGQHHTRSLECRCGIAFAGGGHAHQPGSHAHCSDGRGRRSRANRR
jgi:hypothetical protein